ncbi:DNA mismatch repair protein PMS1 [Candida viswanathii]|uniref:DNA mismatch repair protein PMS1 n=1 Tax=Candida viswanathii TaxID=5486 RepID=A0A367XRR2_9ASCO|nr:DNA mismatch repair protein PMS1 [Candida viswanathii]
MSLPSIQSIGQADISKITSSQVIIDLRSIAKELIENAIDAKANKIDIIFTNYGIDSIQIQDNGKGIEPKDFETVCLRSHTSKIENFEDLNKLTTLGFRGEALNSICSLTEKLTIKTTNNDIYPKCHVLNYDQLGELTKQITEVGGTNYKSGCQIVIEKLFYNLPVRLKNFVKNSKKEFRKATSFIIKYLIIFPEIKFSVYNVMNGKKNLILSSRGGEKTTMIDNLISVFGNNNNKNLLPLDIRINDDITLDGFISSYSFGLGSSARDRQFLYINKRPVVLKKLEKLINDVYKSFNHVQVPIYIINIIINPNLIDVNLTPDKTSILIQREGEVLELIREKLQEFYEIQDVTIIPKNENSQLKSLIINVQQEKPEAPAAEETKLFVEDDLDTSYPVIGSTGSSKIPKEGAPNTIPSQKFDITVIDSLDFPQEPMFDKEPPKEKATPPQDESQSLNHVNEESSNVHESSSLNITEHSMHQEDETCNHDDKHGENFFPVQDQADESLTIDIGGRRFDDERPAKRFKKVRVSTLYKQKSTCSTQHVLESLESLTKFECASSNTNPELNLNADLEEAEIYHINKQDFLDMGLIGQFNLGFILVNHNSNLFIIDQHASDEKFNFEKLMSSFQIKQQPLMMPINLDLNVMDEMLVLDNQETFKNNGFKLTINDDGAAGKRLSLVSLPVYKNSMFTVDDFHELINLISEEPNNKNLKISKIRRILAMKACRSSIMIGSSLSKSKMNEIVKNLSTLDKPWNCPHGRPTMRHLVESKSLSSNRLDYEL